ncbi:MAG: four helix bundle protein [Deltaproteobacteria bacterium]|nr:four helix bundle protein [Deltaproteobacteria bacterium]
MNDQFAFEGLDVYKRAFSFSKKILTITKEIKNQYSWCDQLNRAATSITLNLAEGSGRWHAKDKANFYYIARGSAFECVPLIELGFELGLIVGNQKTELRDDLQAICQMLTKLVQSLRNQ